MSMETKHTPGKWIQSHRKIPNDPEEMYSTQVYTEDGETICSLAWYPKPKVETVMNGKTVYLTESYREANAKLIAAAPLLLDTLMSINNALIFSQNPNDKGLIEMMEAAIKKATE